MYLRKTARLRQVSLDEVLNVDPEGNEMVLGDILGSNDLQSIDILTHDEELKELYYAINKLSPREREIIVLRFGLFDNPVLTQKVANLLEYHNLTYQDWKKNH